MLWVWGRLACPVVAFGNISEVVTTGLSEDGSSVVAFRNISEVDTNDLSEDGNMTIKIGSNIASIQAQRRLGEATSSLSQIYERLSSGQRINKASDDAAGLAIAQDLNSKTRVYTQAIRNGNDGLSALSIADSALDALSGVVTRIRELAEQSANGTYSNKQRLALDNEAQALSDEYLRIARTTSFNGVKVFNGSLSDGLRLQLGYGTEGSINAHIGGTIGNGSFASASNFTLNGVTAYAAELGDINRDGILDLVSVGESTATVNLGLGNGTFADATVLTSVLTALFAVKLGDLNDDGILDLISGGEVNYNPTTTIRLGRADGSFSAETSFTSYGNTTTAVQVGDLNGDGILDLVSAGEGGIDAVATVRLGLGDGSFDTARAYDAEGFATYTVQLGDLNSDGILDLVTAGIGYGGEATVRLGTGNGTFGAATLYTTDSSGTSAMQLGDLNGDGILDLVTAGNSISGNATATVRLGIGNGTFGTIATFTIAGDGTRDIKLGDMNGDGFLDMVAVGYAGIVNEASIRLGQGNGSFGALNTFTMSVYRTLAVQDLNSDGVLDILSVDGNQATSRMTTTKDGLSSLLEFSLKTKSDALQAMGFLQRTQESLAKQRGVIGASQSRVGIALQNLITAKENFTAAESRIRDADVASDSANLIKTQILQKAASSILAQANQVPALALILLR